MKTMKPFLVLCLLLFMGSLVQAQTSGTIYVRDENPSGTYYLYVHVYDAANNYAELSGSPTLFGTITINSTTNWNGGPNISQDTPPRWQVVVEIRKVDPPNTYIKWSIYPSLLSTSQYNAGGLTMPNVSYP